jgi:Ca-activated chloride channel family protein
MTASTRHSGALVQGATLLTLVALVFAAGCFRSGDQGRDDSPAIEEGTAAEPESPTPGGNAAGDPGLAKHAGSEAPEGRSVPLAEKPDYLMLQHYDVRQDMSVQSAPGRGPGVHRDRLAHHPGRPIYLAPEPADRENYAEIDDNPVCVVAEQPVSTFSIDVDTAAYSNVRRYLQDGLLPPSDAVRTEELINYFDYGYPTPDTRKTPFAVTTEIAPAPWNDEAHLLTVGIRGYDVPAAERPAANLVFLVDVSGSMNSPDKLPLLKNAFRLLTRRLTAEDRVAIVVYAGASGLVLESTPGDRHATILSALDRLHAGGSTNGGDGIRLAYSVAADNFLAAGINRVVLATDGDFNVGTVSHESLIDLIERRRAQGIALTTLGFGQGNYNDHLLEQLADHGNGNYAYIDTLLEARKVLVESLSGTLQTIASDVKIQLEFNPATVAEYRLIGYENRLLRREDFGNDRIDAGEIGAGHTVTAVYELKLTDSADRLIAPLRYGGREAGGGDRRELAHLRLRYKAPEGGASKLIERPLRRADIRDPDETSDDFRFAAAVAAFGQALRGGHYLKDYRLDDVAKLARDARGADDHGYRSEFVALVELAESLAPADRVAARPAGER